MYACPLIWTAWLCNVFKCILDLGNWMLFNRKRVIQMPLRFNLDNYFDIFDIYMYRNIIYIRICEFITIMALSQSLSINNPFQISKLHLRPYDHEWKYELNLMCKFHCNYMCSNKCFTSTLLLLIPFHVNMLLLFHIVCTVLETWRCMNASFFEWII